MNHQFNFRKLYICIIFPIYVISNLLSASTFAFAAEGEINNFARLLSYLRYLIYIISIFYACTRQIKKHPLVYASLISLLLIVLLYINRNVQLICAMFVFWALVDFRWDIVLRKQVNISMIVVLIFLCFSQIGLIEDYIRNDGRTRHFLGFNWTTYAPIIWFFVTLGCLCSNSNGKILKQSIGLGIIAYVLYKLTGTRLAFGLTVLSIFLFLLFSHMKKNKSMFRAVTSLTIYSPFICAIASISAHALYNPDSRFFEKLNSLLSQRLYLGKMGIVNYGITLFGQKIIWRGFDRNTLTFENYNFVDCTYLHLLLEFGMVFLIIFLVLLTVGIKKAYKNENYNMCWALCLICVLGMTEPWLLNFTFNPFMFCGIVLFQKPESIAGIKNYHCLVSRVLGDAFNE